jgi:hypothetical protein
MELLAKYWYLLGGAIGLVVFALVLRRMHKQGRFRWKVFAIGLALIAVVGYPLAHVFISNSDAFGAAEGFLRSNHDVVRVVGPVQDVSLSWLSESLEVSGDTGSAQFTVNVRGATDSTRVYVELEKRGIWEITFARLLPSNGTPVLLHGDPANGRRSK